MIPYRADIKFSAAGQTFNNVNFARFHAARVAKDTGKAVNVHHVINGVLGGIIQKVTQTD